MKVGGRRLMILPAALGYGAQGTPDGSIPPNAPIVFVVDLVGVRLRAQTNAPLPVIDRPTISALISRVPS